MAMITFLSVLESCGVDTTPLLESTSEWVQTYDAETGHRVGFVTVARPLVLSSAALTSIKAFMLKNGYSAAKSSSFIASLSAPMRVTREKGSNFNYKMLGPDAAGYDAATSNESGEQLSTSLPELGSLFCGDIVLNGAAAAGRLDRYLSSRGWAPVELDDFVTGSSGPYSKSIVANGWFVQMDYFTTQNNTWTFGLSRSTYYWDNLAAGASYSLSWNDSHSEGDVITQSTARALSSLAGASAVYLVVVGGFYSKGPADSGFAYRVYRRPRTAADGDALVQIAMAIPQSVGYRTDSSGPLNQRPISNPPSNVSTVRDGSSGQARVPGYQAQITAGYAAVGTNLAYGNQGTNVMPGVNGFRYVYGLSRDFLGASIRATPKSLVTENNVIPVGYSSPVKMTSVIDAQWSLTLSKTQVVRIFRAYTAGSTGVQKKAADANIAALESAPWDQLAWWQLTAPYTTDLATCVQNSPVMRGISTDVNVWEELDYDLDPTTKTRWADRVKDYAYITSTFFAREPYATSISDVLGAVFVSRNVSGVVSYEMPPGRTSSQELCATSIALGNVYSLPDGDTLQSVFGYATTDALKTGYADAMLASDGQPATQIAGTPSTVPSYSRTVEFDQVYYHVLGSKQGLTPFIASVLESSYGSDFAKLFPSLM